VTVPAFSTVVFDCDSTLSAIEGVDELAVDHRVEIARLTELAMQGAVPLEEVYGRRLRLIQPTHNDLARLAERYVAELVPGAASVVRALQQHGVAVHILSGGLAPAVRVVATHLGIAPINVAAVDVWFDAAGRYAGFDAASPLTRSGGKRQWLESAGARLTHPILLVGDGATDLEARPAVDCFAAFTGVARREAVVAGADVVVEGPTLEPILRLALYGRLTPDVRTPPTGC